MTDRELLERAARAAGINARWWNVKQWDLRETPAGKCKFAKGVREVFGTHHAKPWNPLTSDADAFRLAVDLGISVQQGLCQVEVSHITLALEGVFIREECLNQDAWNATRRAITRAAAAIGEQK